MLALFFQFCFDNIENPDEPEVKGTPCPGLSTVEHYGKTYHTVLIGEQYWLKENLDIGSMIKSNQNQGNNGTIEKFCYDNKPAYCDKYGGLYQWTQPLWIENP